MGGHRPILLTSETGQWPYTLLEEGVEDLIVEIFT
jgi:hypothetical protein